MHGHNQRDQLMVLFADKCRRSLLGTGNLSRLTTSQEKWAGIPAIYIFSPDRSGVMRPLNQMQTWQRN